jgi:hypothetical protein
VKSGTVGLGGTRRGGGGRARLSRVHSGCRVSRAHGDQGRGC